MAVGVGYSSVLPALVEQVGDKLQLRYNVVPPDPDSDDQSYRFDYVDLDVHAASPLMALYFSSVSEVVAARHAMSEEIGILRKTLAGVMLQIDAVVAGGNVPVNPYAAVFAGYNAGVESVKSEIKDRLGL